MITMYIKDNNVSLILLNIKSFQRLQFDEQRIHLCVCSLNEQWFKYGSNNRNDYIENNEIIYCLKWAFHGDNKMHYLFPNLKSHLLISLLSVGKIFEHAYYKIKEYVVV